MTSPHMVGNDNPFLSRLDNDPMKPLREAAYFTAVFVYVLGLAAGLAAAIITHALWLIMAWLTLAQLPWIGLAVYWNLLGE